MSKELSPDRKTIYAGGSQKLAHGTYAIYMGEIWYVEQAETTEPTEVPLFILKHVPQSALKVNYTSSFPSPLVQSTGFFSDTGNRIHFGPPTFKKLKQPPPKAPLGKVTYIYPDLTSALLDWTRNYEMAD